MITRIPIEISARHVHLSQEDLEALFGQKYELKKLRQLTQPCDFSASETLDIKVNSNILKNVRIVGPVREQTQVELSFTDAINLGIMPPFKISGDLKGTPGLILVGPQKREIKLKQGVIIAARHIHCTTHEAEELGLKNGAMVSVLVKGPREITFHDVVIRVRDDYNLCMHLDTDEGNAAGINKVGEGYLITNT